MELSDEYIADASDPKDLDEVIIELQKRIKGNVFGFNRF